MATLRQLEYLVAVVDEGSFTRAAARVHVTQTALSHQVQALERDVGGPLIHFHVHNDLCWSGGGDRYQVIPAAPVPAPCPRGTERKLLEPMMHVWIVSDPCGPFAALEGISGGQVREGEEVACDHDHGTGL